MGSYTILYDVEALLLLIPSSDGKPYDVLRIKDFTKLILAIDISNSIASVEARLSSPS